MNTTPFPQKDKTGKEQILSEDNQESILPILHERNIADGGEFLDDAIRMKEQPLGETNVKETNNSSQSAGNK